MPSKTEDLPAMTGPGVGTNKIKALDVAVEAWRDVVDKRMALTKKEVETRQKVVDLMHQNGLTNYPYGDEQQVVLVAGQEKVKVKAVIAAEDSENDED